MAAAPSPEQLMLTKLKASALTAADAAHLRFQAVPSALKLHESFYAVPAFSLPYFDLGGQPTGFFRCRYLASTLNGFASLTTAKEQRYSQPPVTQPEVYLPPFVDWRELAGNPEVPLLVTEGELKAACATKLGLPTLGLGGVWSWKSNRAKQPLLPILARDFRWKGRPVYLAYDSDAATNPMVLQAEGALADALGALGAVPYIIRLPQVLPPPAAKTGLDDYLVAEGVEALKGLLANAPAYGPIAALYALNAEVVYVRNPGLVIKLASGEKLSSSAFKEHAYANRYYSKETEKGKLLKLPAAPAWLGWEQRSELARFTFAPGQPRVAGDAYNYWRGWGCAPRRGSVGPWTALLDYLFSGFYRERVWFERWCAYPLQHPGAKLYSAAVMWGTAQGTGKSLVGYTLMKLYGEHATEITDEEMAAAHNEWAENKQFVMGDDVTSGDKRQIGDRLKSMITRLQLRLNPKYIPSYTVPDLINYYFTANHPDAFFMDDTDRRLFVHEAPAAPLPRQFYADYVAWLKSPEGPAALFYHLLHLGMGEDFDPQGPALRTAAKEQMHDLSLSDLGAWVRHLVRSPELVLRLGGAPLGSDLYFPQELLALYDPEGSKRVSANGLGRELRRAGVPYAARGVTLKTGKGTGRLYAVRNGARWAAASSKLCALHYAGAHGGKGEGE